MNTWELMEIVSAGKVNLGDEFINKKGNVVRYDGKFLVAIDFDLNELNFTEFWSVKNEV